MQSDWRGGSKVFRVHIVLILLVALVWAPGAGASPEDTAPGTPIDTLYFLPPAKDGSKNFTTYAPNASAAVLEDPDDTTAGRFFWSWRTPASPETWTLSPKDEILATVHLEGLDRIVPTPDPRSGADGVGKIRVQVDIFIGGGTSTDATVTSTPLDPAYANATGSVFLDAPMIDGDGTTVVAVPLRAQDTFTAPPGLEFAVRVVVSGTTSADSRPNVVVGSPEAPTHIQISSYPADAFRTWEDTLREERACLERVLLGESCTPPSTADPAPPGTAAEEASALPALWVLLGILAVISRSRGTRRR